MSHGYAVRRSLGTLALVVAAITWAAPSLAQDTAEEPDNPLESRADIGLTLGAKIGGGIGAPVSELDASYILELEIGFALPLPAPVNHSLGLFVSGHYSQPGLEGDEKTADTRLPGDGRMHYELTQRELVLTLGALYRIPVGSDLVMPYGGAGARLYLLETRIEGDVDGEPFGENREQMSDAGLLVMGGLEIFLGPGALLGELSFSWAGVEAYVLRDTAVGGLALAVGYRLMF